MVLSSVASESTDGIGRTAKSPPRAVVRKKPDTPLSLRQQRWNASFAKLIAGKDLDPVPKLDFAEDPILNRTIVPGVRIEKGRFLIITLKPKDLQLVLGIADYNDVKASNARKLTVHDYNDRSISGPSAKGLYSKEYTLRHPDIEWTHRGQGRYLPTADVNKDVLPPLTNRSSR